MTDRCYQIVDDQGRELRVRAGKPPDEKTTNALLELFSAAHEYMRHEAKAISRAWPSAAE